MMHWVGIGNFITMKKAYSNLFFGIATVIKKINPKQKDFLDSACAFFSVCITFNILSIVFLLEYCFHFQISNAIVIIVLPIWWLNHKILIQKNKHENLFYHFEREFLKSENKTRMLLPSLLYIILSFGFCFFTAKINR